MSRLYSHLNFASSKSSLTSPVPSVNMHLPSPYRPFLVAVTTRCRRSTVSRSLAIETCRVRSHAIAVCCRGGTCWVSRRLIIIYATMLTSPTSPPPARPLITTRTRRTGQILPHSPLCCGFHADWAEAARFPHSPLRCGFRADWAELCCQMTASSTRPSAVASTRTGLRRSAELALE
jgi:hypothetical protein